MPRAQTPRDLRCDNCDACIAPDGHITCTRCKQSVDIASAKMSGIWSCPKCPEHGEDPKTLAIDGVIECKFCKHKNPIPNTRVTDMSETQTSTLTSQYRNDLLAELGELELEKGKRDGGYIRDRQQSIKKALETMDMGFDIDRFNEIFPGRLNESTSPLSSGYYSTFEYIFPVKQGQGIKHVFLCLMPREKVFSLTSYESEGVQEVFSLTNAVPENISYEMRTHHVKKMGVPLMLEEALPTVVIMGNVSGLPVKITIDKKWMKIKGGDNLNEGNIWSDRTFRYSLRLELPTEIED